MQPVPQDLSTPVDDDTRHRSARIDLVVRLADALDAEDAAAAEGIDEELTALNIKTEAEEDEQGLARCP